jgi:hypothetical protein
MTIILEHMEQGSEEWLNARVGCITMSNAKKLISKGRGDAPSATRATYIAEVASEKVSGVLADRINTWDIIRGNTLEPFARDAYKAITGLDVKEIGLGYLDENRRIAASPDGLTANGGVEIKCQAPKNHMKTIMEAKNPKQFEAQMQGCMWVFGTDTWDYCSFCPEFANKPLVIITAHRNEEMVKQIEEAAHSAVEEVDEYIKAAGDGQVSSLVTNLCLEAIELMDILQNKEVEIL